MPDFDGDLKFRCHLNSHISGQIFWYGYYSRSQLIVLNRLLSDPEMVFFDIGANEGEHTIFAAKRLPHGQVHSFEPSSRAYERLRENVLLNHFQNVTLNTQGLGDRTGSLPLYGGSESGPDGLMNEGLPTIHPRPGVDRPIETIRLARLDDYVESAGIQRLDIMKIDVEGSELAVLKGAEKTLKRLNPVILLEVSDETSKAASYTGRELLAHLTMRGYRFEEILRNGASSPWNPGCDPVHADIICLPSQGGLR